MLNRPPSWGPISAGGANLHRLGYAQQLFREMGGFSNFAISFSIISILTGAILLYGYGLKFAGPIINTVGWPLIRISPESGRWAPERTFISVDFPAPFSPTSAWISPRPRSSETSWFATTAPKRRVMPRSETAGASMARA